MAREERSPVPDWQDIGELPRASLFALAREFTAQASALESSGSIDVPGLLRAARYLREKAKAQVQKG